MQKFKSVLLGGLSFAALAPPAFAQVDEIIVTAQKKAENIQDVPISVIAVTGDTVDDAKIGNLEGLRGSAPNVEIGHFANTPNTAVFTIRGIGVIEPDPYAGNTVAIVVDGVPQYFSMGALLDLYDVDRIEILRGPQGTLFGANTTGGVVNVVNAQPEDEFGAEIQATYGNYNRVNVGGVVTGPIAEGVTGRLSISHDQSDGFVTNVVDGSSLGDRNVTIFRGALRFEPTADLSITAKGEYGRARNGAPIVVAGNLPGEAEFVPPGFLNQYVSPCLPAGSRCEAPDEYLSALDGVPDQSDMDNYQGTITINWANSGIGDITAITGYRQFELFEFTDQDGTPVFLIDTRRGTRGRQFSQEVRTDFKPADAIDVTFGGFFSQTHYDHFQDLRIEFAGGVTYDLPTQTFTKGLPGLFQQNLQDQDNWSASVFAQSYWQLSPSLRLQAGVRYAHEDTEMLASTLTSLAAGGVSTFDGTAPDGTPNTFLGLVAPPRGDESWDNVGWKLGLDFEASDDALLYAHWARGFKSGGFTGRIAIAQDLGPYDPETVDTFEAGLKSDFADNRVRLNLAAFYTIYRDIQLAQIYFEGSGATLVQGNTILNAAKSRIFGFEADTVISVADGLTINGSLGYLNAEYSDFLFQLPDDDANPATPAPVVDLKGERLQNAPKWAGVAGVNYEFGVGRGTARINAQYNYVGEKLLTSIIDTPRARIQPVHLLHGNVEWKPTGDHYTVSFFIRNALDNRYISHVFDSPGTLGLTQYAPPRQFGVSFKIDY